MDTLQYRFDEEKFINALAFFAHRGVADLTKLKAAKLLYFTDKFHLTRFGRPVIGDRYYCLKYGPLPSAADNYMDEAELSARTGEKQFDALFDRYLTVDAAPPYPLYKAKHSPDLDVFSESDLEALENTLQQYGRYSAWELVDLTHDELPFKLSNKKRTPQGRADLPYELFFEGASEDAQRVLELAKIEQRDRDITAALAGR